eukprot:scaffold73502_cov68-Phaeocystis_antarctica.AAC.2
MECGPDGGLGAAGRQAGARHPAGRGGQDRRAGRAAGAALRQCTDRGGERLVGHPAFPPLSPNHRVGRLLSPIASRPAAVSDRASPGVPQRHAWAGERTSEGRAEDDGRAVPYAIVQHAGQRN